MKALSSSTAAFGMLLFFSNCVDSPPSSSTARSTEGKPNIIFVYTDDQGPWTLGISGNPQSKTPNMDRLAREGAYLPNSFATTPVCSPARASLMTSRYGTELGILDFIPHPEHRLFTSEWADVGLDPETRTFVEVLSEAGYTTGLIGKWHLGDWTRTRNRNYHPTNHGFSYFMGLTGGGTTPENPLLEKDGVEQELKGLTTDILADHAIEFIRANRDGPFLLCLNHRAPHGRWLPVSESDWAPYKDLDPVIPNPEYPDLDVERVKKNMREYLASVRGVDRNLGRVLRELDELGLTDKTIVIFSSDHGYNMGHNGIQRKGNGTWITKTLPPETKNIASKYRPNMYDNSLRVPTIVRWPGIIEPGTILTETISSLDWFPTLVSMADAVLEDHSAVRGRDLVPLLTGNRDSNWNYDLYAEYSMTNYCRTHMRMFRTPEWKLVRDFLNPDRDELYDLAEDPEERRNLFGGKTPGLEQIVRELHGKILENMRATNDPILSLAESHPVDSKRP